MTTPAVGSEYQAPAVGSIIGPNHGSSIPDVMWGAWFDASVALIEMTGNTVAHDAFGQNSTGVANIVNVDAGVLPTGAAFFALMDAETSGQIIVIASFTTDAMVGDPIVFLIGTLQFLYGSPS